MRRADADPEAHDGPLSGLRVVAVTSAIAGPYAAKLLGDMGAEVVKVEPTGGGAADRKRMLPYDRHDDPEFTWRFLTYNTGKTSIAIDLKSERGRDVFTRLADSADVLIENLSPGAMERLGLGSERLRDSNPELVFCSIKGYAADGPYGDWPALDTLIQGVSGFATQIGGSSDPETMEILVIDMLTGLYAAWSVTLGLVERGVSGTGQHVDVSMLDAAVSFLGHQLAEYTAARHHDGVEATYDRSFAVNGYYPTADGHIALMIVDPHHWAAFCELVGRPEWNESDHRYATNSSRLDHPDALEADLEAVLTERTTKEWSERFSESAVAVPFAPVNDIDQMVDDPQVTAQEAVTRRIHPMMGEYFAPNVVPRFSRTPGELREAPSLGDGTDRLLEELGYDVAERTALREHGVVE